MDSLTETPLTDYERSNKRSPERKIGFLKVGRRLNVNITRHATPAAK